MWMASEINSGDGRCDCDSKYSTPVARHCTLGNWATHAISSFESPNIINSIFLDQREATKSDWKQSPSPKSKRTSI